MNSLHLRSFVCGVIVTGSLIFLTAATPTGIRVDVTKEWPQELRTTFQHGEDRNYRKYSVETFDIYFSEDRPRHPLVVILRRDYPSPWIVLDSKGAGFHDKAGSIISAESVDTPGVIDRFAYASNSPGKFTYFCDHNLDGTLDIVTTHHPDSNPFIPPQSRLFVEGAWYEVTDERYFEGEWIPEAQVRLAFKAKKKETKHIYRARTPEGFKIIKVTGGIPSFDSSVQ